MKDEKYAEFTSTANNKPRQEEFLAIISVSSDLDKGKFHAPK